MFLNLNIVLHGKQTVFLCLFYNRDVSFNESIYINMSPSIKNVFHECILNSIFFHFQKS